MRIEWLYSGSPEARNNTENDRAESRTVFTLIESG